MTRSNFLFQTQSLNLIFDFRQILKINFRIRIYSSKQQSFFYRVCLIFQFKNHHKGTLKKSSIQPLPSY